MKNAARSLSPSEAARRLGISAKALRIYEQRGLITPERTDAGWRSYEPRHMKIAAQIVALRSLGLSLADVQRVLDGEPDVLEAALETHEARLQGEARKLEALVEKVRALKESLRSGQHPLANELLDLLSPVRAPAVSFALPWPWGGERFELPDIRALNYIIGPLASGKTRLAKKLADALPDAGFLGLDRDPPEGSGGNLCQQPDATVGLRVDRALAWLEGEGAEASDALIALLRWLEAGTPSVLVVDMIEQDLSERTQEALITYLRRRGAGARPIFMLTRSSAILDLDCVGDDEAIIFCPANHSPPFRVLPYPGSPGYEAVATCLASPDVRARTKGVVAVMRDAAT